MYQRPSKKKKKKNPLYFYNPKRLRKKKKFVHLSVFLNLLCQNKPENVIK